MRKSEVSASKSVSSGVAHVGSSPVVVVVVEVEVVVAGVVVVVVASVVVVVVVVVVSEQVGISQYVHLLFGSVV